MRRAKLRKERLSIYLAKRGAADDSDLIKLEGAGQPISLDAGGNKVSLYIKKDKSNPPPPWTKLFIRSPFEDADPFTMDRYGFELSPWSTHGYLKNTKQLTQAEINKLAKDNFASEMEKHRAYFKQHGVVVRIYTDDQLPDTKALFKNEMAPHLKPDEPKAQISFTLMEEIKELLV